MNFELHPKLNEDTIFIHDFSLSRLLLIKDANFKWFVLVPRVDGLREIIDLNEEERILLFREICKISEFLKQSYSPYKLNIAAIGNIVEQLHIHIILRYKDDPLYPNPVWRNNLPKKEYTNSEIELIISSIKQRFA
ncbi:HIT domain-containing protein [Holosporaceae bacterium 'Namur']|nr:HIT domain-containing protein [Holosporaceae bacterium 'Namur']